MVKIIKHKGRKSYVGFWLIIKSKFCFFIDDGNLEFTSANLHWCCGVKLLAVVKN